MHNTDHRFSVRPLLSLFVCILLAFVIGGCGGKASISPPAPERVVLQPGVLVLPLDGSVTLTDLTPSTMFIRGPLSGVGPGTVIISGEGSGIARKVIAVAPSGGGIACQTENASLTDIFRTAHIRIQRQITPADIAKMDVMNGWTYSPPAAVPVRSLIEFEFKYTNAFPGAEADGTKFSTSANAKLKIDLGIEVVIEEGALTKFTVAPTISSSTSLEMGFKQKWEKKYPETPTPYATLAVRPLLFFIGPVPVVVQPNLTLSAEFGMKVEEGATVKLEHSATFRAGATYDAVADQWTPVREITTAGSVTPTPNTFVNAEASLSLAKVGFELLLYNVVGPKLAIDVGKLGAKWEAKTSPDYSAKLSCGLSLSVTGEVKGDGFGKAVTYSFGPKIEFEYPLYEKTFFPGEGDIDIRTRGGRN